MPNANSSSQNSEAVSPSLVYGLDVLSLEAPTARQRRSFARISERLQRGETLDAALRSESRNIPEYLGRLLTAPIASQQLGVLTDRYIRNCQRSQDISRQVLTSLAYPGILVVFTFAILYFLLSWAVQPFKRIFADFGTELPSVTIALVSISDFVTHSGGILTLLCILVIPIVAIWLLLRLTGGKAAPRFVFNSIPALGSVFRYGALARFCDLLALMVQFNVPLPEALRLAGEGSNDSSLRNAGEQLADSAENGVSLAETAENLPEFPPMAAHVFRWEHRQSAFAEGFEAAADVFSARTHLESGMLRVVLEPFVLAFIAFSVGFVLLALFLPLIKLLNDLS